MKNKSKYFSKETFNSFKNTEYMKKMRPSDVRETIVYVGAIILGLVMAVSALPKPNYFGITMGCAFMSAAISNLEPIIKKPWLCMTGIIIEEKNDEEGEFNYFRVRLENDEEISLCCEDHEKFRVGNKVYAYARLGSSGTVADFC